MNLKRWLHLFWTTLAVGAAGSLVIGLVLQLTNTTNTMELNGAADYLLYLGMLLLAGVMVSVYSQMGFFAYMMVNYMGTGVFSRRAWLYVQLVLTALALFELMFLRIFVGGHKDSFSDLILGIIILVIACGVAYFKAKMTNDSAWIPTIFFMTAITIVETIGVLKIGVDQATVWVAGTLIACNAYQILILHRLVKPKASTTNLHVNT
ncbi:KinB-signaling pathway activation protein [Paenibacillus aceti]|uniref:KinB-signaling pathway activation protein n=1 Tax=Paenibacillus aceti TaxID=1820010 RepID=A0ABQ1W358_9BACL|nr:KinB-signaling pathway activation protein [Paenibacillus aceti]GGG11190.1 KinB-signaling pathway activation protein [Paenibacillus aceti]